MYKSKHDQVAEKLAAKFHAQYESDKGIDIVTSRRVIEVEVKRSGVEQGYNQVVRSSKPRYLAVSKTLIKTTLERTKGTGVGVMSETGRIIKRATR